jgi:3-methyl-2-oxobutanoate hydroxymethyltransferase
MKRIPDFRRYREEGRRIAMVTCYDAWSARLIASSGVDCVLVGDSSAMVVHGHATTVSATTPMIADHVAAVRRAAPDLLAVADMPFLAHRQGVAHAVATAGALLQAGAQAVKLEGLRGHEQVVEALVQAGVPVMGHLGLTPQSVHQLGGHRVQGRSAEAARRLLEDARGLERLGAFGVVLEMVPSELAREVTRGLGIPTIGIGAGPHTSGQILVLHDLLGLDPRFRPRFVRRYLEGAELVRGALDRYAEDVRSDRFPSEQEAHHADGVGLDTELANAPG